MLRRVFEQNISRPCAHCCSTPARNTRARRDTASTMIPNLTKSFKTKEQRVIYHSKQFLDQSIQACPSCDFADASLLRCGLMHVGRFYFCALGNTLSRNRFIFHHEILQCLRECHYFRLRHETQTCLLRVSWVHLLLLWTLWSRANCRWVCDSEISLVSTCLKLASELMIFWSCLQKKCIVPGS
jgi:hypothetical protein